VTTRTQTAIADVEEFLDLLKTKSDALGALDEPEYLDRLVLVGAVAGFGATCGEESCALVVADRVGCQASSGYQFRYREGHATRVDFGVDSNVNLAGSPLRSDGAEPPMRSARGPGMGEGLAPRKAWRLGHCHRISGNIQGTDVLG
jgi:hypothetical protein